MGLTEHQIAWAMANRPQVRSELERVERKERAEESLLSFMDLTWPALEPGREFVRGWAVEAICEHLEAVSRGEIHRLLINVPPGCTKSMTTSVFFPAWEWGPRNRASLRYVSWAYAQDLTVRDNLRCRRLIQSDTYQANWGDRFQFVSDQNAKVKFENDKTGYKLATSVGGVGTGERGDRLIIDDPHNVREGESEAKREDVLFWFSESLSSRFNDDDTAVIVIMQRVHERDVSGLILEKELGYTHLCLPMRFESERRCSTSVGFTDPRKEDGELLWPERFSEQRVAQLEKEMSSWGGSYAVAGQLQQRPAPRGGGMFQRSDFQIVERPETGGHVVRHWDLAASTSKTADWTVGCKLRMTDDERLIVEDVVRGKWSPHERDKIIKATAEQDGHGVKVSLPIDPGQAGLDQKRHLAKLLHGHDVVFKRETGDKATRATPVAAQAEAGNLWLVRASWNDALIDEACVFPAGRHDDIVDALSGAYARLLVPKAHQGTGLPGYAGAA